jgi:hypothetical protein
VKHLEDLEPARYGQVFAGDAAPPAPWSGPPDRDAGTMANEQFSPYLQDQRRSQERTALVIREYRTDGPDLHRWTKWD